MEQNGIKNCNRLFVRVKSRANCCECKAASTRRNFHATDSRASQVACISELHALSTRCILKVLRIVCIPLSFIHFRQFICELRASRCVKIKHGESLKKMRATRRIRLHLKMHTMVARKLHGNCVVWTQSNTTNKHKIRR